MGWCGQGDDAVVAGTDDRVDDDGEDDAARARTGTATRAVSPPGRLVPLALSRRRRVETTGSGDVHRRLATGIPTTQAGVPVGEELRWAMMRCRDYRCLWKEGAYRRG